jgi:hypothetical protein
MKSTCRLTAALLLAVASSTNASDQNPYERCPPIKDSGKRLQCFDAAFKQASIASQQAEAEKVTRAKEDFAKAEAARGDKATKERGDAVAAAKEALKGLKKLQVRVETGVSFKDYPTILSDARFEVRQFNDSTAAKQLPEVASAINSAIRHYERAKELWNYKFAGKAVTNAVVSTDTDVQMAGGGLNVVRRVNPAREAYMDSLASDYGLVITAPDRDYKHLYIDSTLAVIWAAGSKDIARATGLIPQ